RACWSGPATRNKRSRLASAWTTSAEPIWQRSGSAAATPGSICSRTWGCSRRWSTDCSLRAGSGVDALRRTQAAETKPCPGPGTGRTAAQGSAPDQAALRVLHDHRDVVQHPGAELTVHQPVVEGERQLGDPARFHLALVHPRPLRDRTEREDGRLPGVEDRGAGVDAEDADVGDRDGPVAHRRRL